MAEKRRKLQENSRENSAEQSSVSIVCETPSVNRTATLESSNTDDVSHRGSDRVFKDGVSLISESENTKPSSNQLRSSAVLNVFSSDRPSGERKDCSVAGSTSLKRHRTDGDLTVASKNFKLSDSSFMPDHHVSNESNLGVDNTRAAFDCTKESRMTEASAAPVHSHMTSGAIVEGSVGRFHSGSGGVVLGKPESTAVSSVNPSESANTPSVTSLQTSESGPRNR